MEYADGCVVDTRRRRLWRSSLDTTAGSWAGSLYPDRIRLRKDTVPGSECPTRTGTTDRLVRLQSSDTTYRSVTFVLRSVRL